jgi:hypothetical protein
LRIVVEEQALTPEVPTRFERRKQARRRRDGLGLPPLRHVDDGLAFLPKDIPLHEEATVLEVDVGLVQRDDLAAPKPAVAAKEDRYADARVETGTGFDETHGQAEHASPTRGDRARAIRENRVAENDAPALGGNRAGAMTHEASRGNAPYGTPEELAETLRRPVTPTAPPPLTADDHLRRASTSSSTISNDRAPVMPRSSMRCSACMESSSSQFHHEGGLRSGAIGRHHRTGHADEDAPPRVLVFYRADKALPPGRARSFGGTSVAS